MLDKAPLEQPLLLAPLEQPLLPNGRWPTDRASDLVWPGTPATQATPTALTTPASGAPQIDLVRGISGESTTSLSGADGSGTLNLERQIFSESGTRLFPRLETDGSNPLSSFRKDVRKSTTGLLHDSKVRRRTRVVAETTDGWTRHLVVAAQSANRLPNTIFTQFDIISDGKTSRGFKYFQERGKILIDNKYNRCEASAASNKNIASEYVPLTSARSCKYVQLVTMNSWADDLGWTLVGTGLLSVSVYSTATFIAANVGSEVPELVHALAFLFVVNLCVQMSSAIGAANRNWKASVLPEYGGGNSASGDLIVAVDPPHCQEDSTEKDEISMTQRAYIKLWLFLFQLCNVPRIIKDAPAQLHPWKGVGQFAALKVSGSRMHLIGHRSDFEFRALNREGQLVRLACGLIAETVMALLKGYIIISTQQTQMERAFFNILTVLIPFLINFQKIFVIHELIHDRNKFYKLLKGELGVESKDPAVKKVSLNLLWQFFGEKEPKHQQPASKNIKKKSAVSPDQPKKRCLPRLGQRIQLACQVEKGFQIQPPKHPATSSSQIARRMLVRVDDLKRDLKVLEGFWELDDNPISNRLSQVIHLLLSKALPCYFEVTAMRNLESSPLGFPHSLGPLAVGRCEHIKPEYLKIKRVAGCDELQWTLSIDRFAGSYLDPLLHSLGSRNGVLSPLHDVTFNSRDAAYDRDAACIPKQANCYAISYPVAGLDLKYKNDDTDVSFLTWGGLVYFDNQRDLNVVGVNAFVGSGSGDGGIGFGPPKEWDPAWTERFWQAGRFQPVTLPYQGHLHASETNGLKLCFCWLLPRELLGTTIKGGAGGAGGAACGALRCPSGERTPSGGQHAANVLEDVRMGHHGGFVYMLLPARETTTFGEADGVSEARPLLEAGADIGARARSSSFAPLDIALQTSGVSSFVRARAHSHPKDMPVEIEAEDAEDALGSGLYPDAVAGDQSAEAFFIGTFGSAADAVDHENEDFAGELAGQVETVATPEIPMDLALASSRADETFESMRSGSNTDVSDEIPFRRQLTEARAPRDEGAGMLSLFGFGKAVSQGRATIQVRQDFGTCALNRATTIIVTEEGIGQCFCYAYERRADAEAKMAWWRFIARIMYSCGEAMTEEIVTAARPMTMWRFRRLEQLSRRGPTWAHESICIVVDTYLRYAERPDSTYLSRITEGEAPSGSVV